MYLRILWHIFTLDIIIAFLQGKNFHKDSNRIIWIRLPRDTKQLLGMAPDAPSSMRLVKPMYGLCDAPRAWYEEAIERILRVGQGNTQRHPLDSYLFMIYRSLPKDQLMDTTVERDLAYIFGIIHVDDLVGCGDLQGPYFNEIKVKLKSAFTFREWQDDNNLEYSGNPIKYIIDDILNLNQVHYFHKMNLYYAKEYVEVGLQG